MPFVNATIPSRDNNGLGTVDGATQERVRTVPKVGPELPRGALVSHVM